MTNETTDWPTNRQSECRVACTQLKNRERKLKKERKKRKGEKKRKNAFRNKERDSFCVCAKLYVLGYS